MHSFLSKNPTEIVKVSLRSKHGWESSAMWSMLLNLGNRKISSQKRERKIISKQVGSTIINGNTD